MTRSISRERGRYSMMHCRPASRAFIYVIQVIYERHKGVGVFRCPRASPAAKGYLITANIISIPYPVYYT